MSAALQAVFLSYASQDTEAARKICDALRGAGIEVWFDVEGGLEHGDEWDAKIRRQIKECVLFIPIVSPNTQARREGYFRREWKLAVERMQDMADGTPFLLPVALGGVSERDALVPDVFLKVQWTRMPADEVPATLVARVKKLMGGTTEDQKVRVPEGQNPSSPRGGPCAPRAANPASPVAGSVAGMHEAPRASPRKRSISPLLAGGILLAAAAGFLAWHSLRPIPPASANSVASPTAAKAGVELADAKSKSVAVLPFENLSDEAGNAYFADGMHDEVLMAVGKVSGLKVIGRTSVMRYADVKRRDLREIASTLGVATVVEGTVRRVANRVRIAVRLVDTQTERQLWGDSYERELTDAFAIQSSIAQQVAATLKTALTADERAVLAQQPTRNPEAYRLYLEGMAMARSMGVASRAPRARVDAVISLFEQAAAADPLFVRPRLQLVAFHGTLFWFGDFEPSPERARKAEAVAEQIRQLAPDSPEAHLATAGILYRCRNEWAAALEEYRIAAQGLPNDSGPLEGMANSLRRLGRWSECLMVYERVLALDPYHVGNAQTFLETLISMRRFPEVLQASERLFVHHPESPILICYRAQAQFEIDGKQDAYFASLAAFASRLDGFSRLWLFQGYLMQRNFAKAETVLAASGGKFSGPGGVLSTPVSHNRALIAFLQGDQERAKRLSAETQSYFEARPPTQRQRPVLAAELALSHALAGDAAAARAAAARSAALMSAMPDALVEGDVRLLRGAAMIVIGDADAALAELALLMRDACPTHVTPGLLRLDPLWSRLSPDPRFEAILKKARRL